MDIYRNSRSRIAGRTRDTWARVPINTHPVCFFSIQLFFQFLTHFHFYSPHSFEIVPGNINFSDPCVFPGDI